jgi:hypothetical protein
VTNIYYPASFLVEGGPPFEVNCPLVPKDHEDENLPIKLSCILEGPLDNTRIKFLVHAQGRILVESENRAFILAYLKQYMDGVSAWAAAL